MSSAPPKTILVTGGTGFIGASLVRALVDRGDVVRVLDNGSRGSIGRLAPEILRRIHYIEGDIRDYQTVRSAVDGVDLVCHLAFINGTRYFYEVPERVIEVGLKGSLNTIEACIELGVREYVYASSSEVYQTPPAVPTDESVAASIPDVLNPRYSYGGTKLMGELMAFNYGRKHFSRTIVFRPHNVYGPNMGFEHVIPEFILRLHKAAAGRKDVTVGMPIQGDGRDTRAFNYIDDFTAGLLLILDKGADQTVYHIGTDREVSVAELASGVAEAMGVRVRLEPGAAPPGGTARRCPDISRLRSLGYEPQVDLATGLRRTAAWYVDWAEGRRSEL